MKGIHPRQKTKQITAAQALEGISTKFYQTTLKGHEGQSKYLSQQRDTHMVVFPDT